MRAGGKPTAPNGCGRNTATISTLGIARENIATYFSAGIGTSGQQCDGRSDTGFSLILKGIPADTTHQPRSRPKKHSFSHEKAVDEIKSAWQILRDMKNKLPLPKGKITIRHRQMRNVFQCFAGRDYITGASGDDDEEAAKELARQYDVPKGTIATVYGYKKPCTIIIPIDEDQ
jgi:hypothetical protein